MRNKGILSELEYKEKLNRIKDSKLEASVIKTEEYQQLQTLFEEGFVTENELREKIGLIKNELWEKTGKDEESIEEASNYYYDEETGYYRRNQPIDNNNKLGSSGVGNFLLVICVVLFLIFIWYVGLYINE